MRKVIVNSTPLLMNNTAICKGPVQWFNPTAPALHYILLTSPFFSTSIMIFAPSLNPVI